MQDVLTAIRLNMPVAEAGLELRANAERHLKPAPEMARLFRRHPEALAETLRFAGELGFSLSDLEYNYPDEPTESGLEPQEELERLTWKGARKRYPDGVSAKVSGIIRHELGTIRELNYARYFLTVHDIVEFARSQRNSLPGARLGRQFGYLLLHRHHRCRAGHHRCAFRALHFGRAQ